ncbi:MAG: chloride channel protein, partial [Pseudomonadales bacterium]
MTRKLSSDYSMRGFRRQLASIDAVPQFAVLGIISGALTGIVILAFRALIELPLEQFVPDFEKFESFPSPVHLALPVAGGIALAILFSWLKTDTTSLGVVHVLQRLARFQGYMPWRNTLGQFFGGAIALASGQSGGREGPAIHLGAASSSLLGQYLQLPNNSIRVLVGCGAAAAISASFHTPMAGVIFSMEVILMEYTIAGFVPVILAAVTAAIINQAVYGRVAAFDVPPVAMNTFVDLPFLILQGVMMGCLAAVFVRTIQTLYRIRPRSIWARMMVAGTCTGLVALFVPEVMGVGYDTVTQSLGGELPLMILLAACAFKLLTSATAVAFGLPVGVIGPALFIGATAGGILGMIGAALYPEHASTPGFYVMLGMGAMMGAVLQAPLAALIAVMELTHNPNIILPAMLVIIIANMTASQVFGLKSIFIMQMEMMGLEFRTNPLSMALDRASVASIMSRSFERVPRVLSINEADNALKNNPLWLLVDGQGEDKRPAFILRTEDLINHLNDNKDSEEVDL